MENLISEQAEMEIRYINRKWRTRRRMAIGAFFMVNLIAMYYLASPKILTIEEAKVLADFNSIIMTLITFLIGLVMLYVGAATTEDIKNKK